MHASDGLQYPPLEFQYPRKKRVELVAVLSDEEFRTILEARNILQKIQRALGNDPARFATIEFLTQAANGQAARIANGR